jgi:muramoyltetrapeptide carboxypeptidase
VHVPAALKPGDRIAVVAPSSPLPRESCLAGLAWLAQRYTLVMHSDVFARDGFLAGDDARRIAELARAMRDTSVRAIVIARGGYGATRIVGRLPWDDYARDPKWIVGFSDVTALHVHACRLAAGIHGPNVTGLGASSNPRLAQNRGAWIAALEHPHARREWRGLRTIRSGRASGPLFGGNLALLCAMAAAGALTIPEGAIVMLEDVTEKPYRVDRMLTSLISGGYFSRASAVVFGTFEQCDPQSDGVTALDVISERGSSLGITVLSGAPFGHGTHNEAFALGATGTVADGTLTWLL